MTNIQPYSSPRLYQSYTVLSDTQIRDLPTSPQVVIPSPGPGLIAIVINVVNLLKIVTPYTSVTNAAWYLCYTNSGATASTLDNLVTPLGFAGEYIRIGVGAPIALVSSIVGAEDYLGGLTGYSAILANSSVKLRDDWASGNYEDGGSQNLARITVLYHLFDINEGLFI